MPNHDVPPIFRAAMADLWRHRRAALGIVFWLFIILVAVERRYLQAAERSIFDPSQPLPIALEWIDLNLGLIIVPLIALPWHWLILSGGQGVPIWREARAGVKVIALYLIYWIIYGIIITLAVALPVAVCAGALYLIGNDAFLDLVIFGPVGPGLGQSAALDWALQFLVFGGGILAFTYLYFRLALGLPHIAFVGSVLPMRESWNRTAPLSQALWWCAIGATLATMALVALPIWADLASHGDFEMARSTRTLTLLALLNTATEVVLILGGAAILSRIYLASAPEGPDPTPIAPSP